MHVSVSDHSIIPAESEASPQDQTLDQPLEDAPFLLFRLGTSVYGVPALAVRTIHALPALLPLQETAHFIVGVFNLRGSIVPVMDLNLRFGLPPQPYQLNDSVVVITWNGAEVAVIVNEVTAVIRLFPYQIEATPTHGRRHESRTPFVEGVAKIDDSIVMLLNLPHLLEWNTTEKSLSSEESPVGDFEAQGWSAEDRMILQERATQLRTRSDDSNEDAQAATEMAPVAIVALGGEEFGVELQAVREFASVKSVTPVPCCPPHILGQINLRGDIVTLVDVRQTLRTARTTPEFFVGRENSSREDNPQSSRDTVPVVVVEHENAPVGIAVDELRGVLYLRESERRALELSTQSSDNGKYFADGALHEGRILPLLDVSALFEEGDLEVEEYV